MLKVKHETIDRIAATSSVICSIHCAMMPLLLILIPYGVMQYIASETFERIFLAASLLLALTSICYGFYKHRRKMVFVVLSLGIVVIVIAHAFEETKFHGVLMALGGLSLCVSHYMNLKFCRSCASCH